jgi:hypothetical protein
MSRFHIGVPILLLAKYANLYPAGSGIVRSINANPARELFDEYDVEFPDGAIEMVHDFQVVEDAAAWPILQGSFSREFAASASKNIRGVSVSSRGLFSATPFEVDLQLGERDSRSFLLGQIIEKGRAHSPLHSEVRLNKDTQPIDWIVANDLDEFEFSDIPPLANVIEVLVRKTHQRILINIPGRRG